MNIDDHPKEILRLRNKCCGNCRHHAAYHYPETIFCFGKFGNTENPVKSIFDACPEWELKEQTCVCLDDALKR